MSKQYFSDPDKCSLASGIGFPLTLFPR